MIYLVRHAAHSLVDRVLCGRACDVSLSDEGAAQARRLAIRLASTPIDVVQSSPRRRTRETAAAIAERHALDVECAESMDELDAGEWSGRSFESLAPDPAWVRWNSCRGSARAPGGESMAELQARVIAHIEKLRAKTANAVIVTHAEPIRAALLYYRNIPLDRYGEIEVAPASVIALRNSRGRVDARIVNTSVQP
jgi:probable phosphoglycerate mutase